MTRGGELESSGDLLFLDHLSCLALSTQRLGLLTGAPTGFLDPSQYGGLRAIRLVTCQLKYKQKGECVAFRDPSWKTHTLPLIPAYSIGQSIHEPAQNQGEEKWIPPPDGEVTKSKSLWDQMCCGIHFWKTKSATVMLEKMDLESKC